MEKRHAIIVAGGSGRRMGSSTPKQFLTIAGKPVLMHTIEAFRAFDPQIDIVLVLPDQHLMSWKQLVQKHQFKQQHKIALGGPTRFASVKNGLSLLPNSGTVGVHDGVRPLVSVDTIERCYTTASEKGNAVPVVPVEESLREIVESGSRSLNRDYFRKVQTPQCFRLEVLKPAYQQGYVNTFTDDASVVENAGESINLVDGNVENIKLTTPIDLQLAELLLAQR